MTVVSEGPLCLKIHLSRYEIKKYFNNYSKINIDDPIAKKTIDTLFNIAINISDFKIKGKRLIEVFPTVSGGCILKFTSDPLPFQIESRKESNNLKLKNNTPSHNQYIYCFKSFEHLLSLVEAYFFNKPTQCYESTLFRANKKFFLKILIPSYDIRTAVFINEYSAYSAKGAIAESLLFEYAEILIKNNAISILSKFFTKNNL